MLETGRGGLHFLWLVRIINLTWPRDFWMLERVSTLIYSLINFISPGPGVNYMHETLIGFFFLDLYVQDNDERSALHYLSASENANITELLGIISKR